LGAPETGCCGVSVSAAGHSSDTSTDSESDFSLESEVELVREVGTTVQKLENGEQELLEGKK